MARLTNKLRLPESVVRAVSNDSYSKLDADFSVTELLNPPQVVHLRKKHADEIEEDVSDRVWSLIGQSVHSIIERGADGLTDVLSEVTLIVEHDGKRIKGTMDSVTLSRAELNDYKVTTAWKVKGGQPPEEWVQQTNIYRWMIYKQLGIEINAIAIIALLRDWSKLEAARNPDYPQAQVVRLDIPLWTHIEVESFLSEKIAEHSAAEPRPCTDAERWLRPSKFAVMKAGKDRAVKLLDTYDAADAFIRESKDGSKMHIVERPRDAVRCQNYCAAAKFCPQYLSEYQPQTEAPNFPFTFGESQ